MSKNDFNSDLIRDYLLGRIVDETILSEIEDNLFSDDEFCDRLELLEDELVNDFANGNLSIKDAADFEKTLGTNPDRKLNVRMTSAIVEKALLPKVHEKPGLQDLIRTFFKQPLYAASFATIFAALVLTGFYFLSSERGSELAGLYKIYETSRPVGSRLSDFPYAPFSAERGVTDSAHKSKLRIIENTLLESVERNQQSAESHHGLGVFYLTQGSFEEAIKELKSAVALDAKNARFRNDLAAGYAEASKTNDPQKRLRNLALANEEFSKALEIDGNNLEALFNRSSVLEELNLPIQAEQSWKRYLELDSQSKWAAEARERLKKLEESKRSSKSADDVLKDFLAAVDKENNELAWKIHSHTKGAFTGDSVHEKLISGILAATLKGDQKETQRFFEALEKIAELEKKRNGDFFFADLAERYSTAGKAELAIFRNAKSQRAEGVDYVNSRKYTEAIAKFESSKSLFAGAGNGPEADISALWAAELLPDLGKIEESRMRLNSLIEKSKAKKQNFLEPVARYWISVGYARERKFSKSIKEAKTALEIAKETDNVFEIAHLSENISLIYGFLGEFEKAAAFLDPTAGSIEAYGNGKHQVYRNLFTLSNLLKKLDYSKTAVDSAKESYAFSKIHLGDSQAPDFSINALVGVLVNDGQIEEAEKYADEAVELANRNERSPENLTIEAAAFESRANVKRRMQDCTSALADYAISLEKFAEVDDSNVRIYDVRKGKLLCLKELGRIAEFRKELKSVLKLSEIYRKEIREDDLRQSFFSSEQAVFDLAIADALEEGNAETAYKLLEDSKSRSLLDFVSSDKSIAEIEQDFSSVSEPLSIYELRQRMPDGIQIVQYALLEKKLAIFIVSRNEFRLVEKPVENERLMEKVSGFRNMILEKETGNRFQETADELYKLLIPNGLDKRSVICIIPDKFLHGVPFAALSPGNGKFLVEEMSLSYSPSSSVFVIATENLRKRGSTASERLLAVGNPTFDRIENPGLPDLPAAANEVEVIASVYDDGETFIGIEAMKDKFLAGLESADIIHFAGHYVSNPVSPSDSKLVFADEDLRSSELSATKLNNAKLVFLSACETGFETLNNSEGAVGIARTFLAMGAPNVVATSWKVDSDATRDIAVSFHKNRRKKGLSVTQALRQSQIENIGKGKPPYFWAAFSVFGGYSGA